MPRMPRDGAAHLAVVLPLGKLSATPVSRHVLLAYTEDYAIEYLGRKLRPYWQRNGQTVAGHAGRGGARLPCPGAARQALRRRTDRRPRKDRRPGLCATRHPRLPPDPGRARLRRRLRRHAHALPQGELLQRLHLHRGRALPLGAVLPVLQSACCSRRS